ncbi:MAG: Prephenate dehydrogenase [Bacteroidota bacterium]|nr:MAG: Prephenate dehydrogenase [Bacteroidota bacterium]
MKVSFIGIGLMNGSLSLDLQRLYPNVLLEGISRKETTLDRAMALELIHQKGTLDSIENADMVFVSIPVEAIAKLLPQILDKVGENTLVVDFGSTKTAICEAVATHPKRNQFLAAHPIAGTEFSGPDAAIPNLYDGKTMMLCEATRTRPDLLQRAENVLKELNMVVRHMDPVAHDRRIAYVSHLSHITSFMLGKTVLEKETDEQNIFDMAGSGFASTVRLAKSSPEMWMPIFIQNKDNVLETLNEYISNLNAFKEKLEAEAVEELLAEMKDINRIKSILKHK